MLLVCFANSLDGHFCALLLILRAAATATGEQWCCAPDVPRGQQSRTGRTPHLDTVEHRHGTDIFKHWLRLLTVWLQAIHWVQKQETSVLGSVEGTMHSIHLYIYTYIHSTTGIPYIIYLQRFTFLYVHVLEFPSAALWTLRNPADRTTYISFWSWHRRTTHNTGKNHCSTSH